MRSITGSSFAPFSDLIAPLVRLTGPNRLSVPFVRLALTDERHELPIGVTAGAAGIHAALPAPGDLPGNGSVVGPGDGAIEHHGCGRTLCLCQDHPLSLRPAVQRPIAAVFPVQRVSAAC